MRRVYGENVALLGSPQNEGNDGESERNRDSPPGLVLAGARIIISTRSRNLGLRGTGRLRLRRSGFGPARPGPARGRLKGIVGVGPAGSDGTRAGRSTAGGIRFPRER